jgi:hypothetical protein
MRHGPEPARPHDARFFEIARIGQISYCPPNRCYRRIIIEKPVPYFIRRERFKPVIFKKQKYYFLLASGPVLPVSQFVTGSARCVMK